MRKLRKCYVAKCIQRSLIHKNLENLYKNNLSGDFKIDLIALIVGVFATVYLHFYWSFQYWKNRNVPYLKPSVPFGTQVPPYKQTIGYSLADQYKDIKEQGWKCCGMYFLGRPVLFLTDLELLKHVLTKDFNHFVARGLYVNEKNENLTGNLFAIGGSNWRKIRKELTPTFTSGKLKQMFQILEDCSVVLEQYTGEFANKNILVDILRKL